jgi:hypothetical protein
MGRPRRRPGSYCEGRPEQRRRDTGRRMAYSSERNAERCSELRTPFRCAMSARTIRGRVAVVGVGETTYYRHGQAPEPEFVLALQAILRACEDAGLDPREVDGFASYSNDRNDPSRLAAALGLPELRFSKHAMGWRRRRRFGGGGKYRRGHRRWLCRLRRRFPRAGPGPVPALRGGAPRPRGVGRAGAHLPLWAHLPGPALRHAGHALHAQPRHPAGDPAHHRPRLLSPRPGQSPGRDASAAAHP